VILSVGLFRWLVLRYRATLRRHVGGDHGIESIQRIMGFLLVCIGVQYIATGIHQLSSPKISANRPTRHLAGQFDMLFPLIGGNSLKLQSFSWTDHNGEWE